MLNTLVDIFLWEFSSIGALHLSIMSLDEQCCQRREGYHSEEPGQTQNLGTQESYLSLVTGYI